MTNTNIGHTVLNHGCDERMRIARERRKAQSRQAGKCWHTRSREERQRTNAEIADYLRRVPRSPVY